MDEVEVDVECDELELAIDRALPVGLILNETAMNSIKHAFGAEGGRISVSLVGGVGYGEARLTVTDNGRGIQHPNKNGSGLKLITSLARQIGGTVDQTSSDAGTTTTLTFPLIRKVGPAEQARDRLRLSYRGPGRPMVHLRTSKAPYRRRGG